MSKKYNWVNKDGLIVSSGARTKTSNTGLKVSTAGATQQIVVQITAETINAAGAVTAPDYTTQDWFQFGAIIPNNSVITSAKLIVTEAFAGSSTTLDIGTYYANTPFNADNSLTAGSALDEDGIDVAVALTALTDNDVVICDGAQVITATGTDKVIVGDVVIGFDIDTAALTDGTATLVVEYIPALI